MHLYGSYGFSLRLRQDQRFVLLVCSWSGDGPSFFVLVPLFERSNTFTFFLIESWGPGSDDTVSQKTQEFSEFLNSDSWQWWLGGTSGDV